ncbi:MAG: peptidoglycan editing factor PgeF [Firmicutes bacterium]|nr:peptidoglycan editing factor PgeF [Bacillota bacterium]
MAGVQRRLGEFIYWSFEPFLTGVGAVFTGRHGGVSRGPFATLNLAFHVGDDEAAVRRNRETVYRHLNLRPGDVVVAEQVHGAAVAVVDRRHAGSGALGPPELPGVDALLTAVPGLVLGGLFADCVPVYLYDPVRKVVGLVHAGWRGTAAGVAARAVAVMERTFGTRPGDCLAVMGPAVGPCCYRVGDDVARALRPLCGGEGPPFLWPAGEGRPSHAAGGPRGPGEGVPGAGRWRLDLWLANRRWLVSAGLREEHIAASGLCTACRTDLFFSHRREGGRTGRCGAFIWLPGGRRGHGHNPGGGR